jgi:hypothetical protein
LSGNIVRHIKGDTETADGNKELSLMARGYDNPRFNQEILLDLQFSEGTGTVTADWAKAHHEPNTLTGAPAWTNLANDLTVLDFDAAAPYDHIIILAADSGDLDFTSGAFSGAAWFYPHAMGNRYIFNKGTTLTGWDFYIVAGTGEMRFSTHQAGPTSQYTDGQPLTLNTWQFVGFTRSGANARIYVDGLDDTVVFGTHVNPVSSAAENFYIGCTDLVAAGWLDGYLWRPRIWGRALAAAEMLAIYEMEKSLFGI